MKRKYRSADRDIVHTIADSDLKELATNGRCMSLRTGKRVSVTVDKALPSHKRKRNTKSARTRAFSKSSGVLIQSQNKEATAATGITRIASSASQEEITPLQEDVVSSVKANLATSHDEHNRRKTSGFVDKPTFCPPQTKERLVEQGTTQRDNEPHAQVSVEKSTTPLQREPSDKNEERAIIFSPETDTKFPNILTLPSIRSEDKSNIECLSDEPIPLVLSAGRNADTVQDVAQCLRPGEPSSPFNSVIETMGVRSVARWRGSVKGVPSNFNDFNTNDFSQKELSNSIPAIEGSEVLKRYYAWRDLLSGSANQTLTSVEWSMDAILASVVAENSRLPEYFTKPQLIDEVLKCASTTCSVTETLKHEIIAHVSDILEVIMTCSECSWAQRLGTLLHRGMFAYVPNKRGAGDVALLNTEEARHREDILAARKFQVLQRIAHKKEVLAGLHEQWMEQAQEYDVQVSPEDTVLSDPGIPFSSQPTITTHQSPCTSLMEEQWF